MPVQSVHIENTGWPNIVAEASKGVCKRNVAVVAVTLDFEGGPAPAGAVELNVPAGPVPEDR